MTQRVDIPASDIEQLLRQLACQAECNRSSRTNATLRILAMTKWSGRVASICIATLTGIAITLFVVSNAETPARARPVITESASTTTKSDPLFSFHGSSRHDSIQTSPAKSSTIPGSRFTFIRGGLDDMLTWMPAKQPATEAPPKPRRPKLRPSHKAYPKPARSASTAEKRQPWLIDLIIRHVARGS